jgi:hypothetical protein
MPIHRPGKGAHIEDILDMMLTVVPIYGVNQNRFMYEAAKISVFAKFLHESRQGICNYVSNCAFEDYHPKVEPYSNQNMHKLRRIVSETLGCDEDWE